MSGRSSHPPQYAGRGISSTFANVCSNSATRLSNEARSGSTWYRTRKFVRRYRVPVVAALLVIASLAAGLYATNRQRAIAERRFALARRLANSLVFDADDKGSNASSRIELREQISSTAVEYLDALSKEAGKNYALRRELAAGYLRLAAAQYANA